MNNMEMERFLAIEVAEKINSIGYWDSELCARLCELAGLEEEWENCNGDDAESVIYKAAEILNVEI